MAEADKTDSLAAVNGTQINLRKGESKIFRFQEAFPKALVVDDTYNQSVIKVDSRLELFNNITTTVQGVRLVQIQGVESGAH